MSKKSDQIEVIARGVFVADRKLLVCRNEMAGYFYLPGGHVEFGESAAEACGREFMEESGLDVRVGECALACEVRFKQAGKARHELNLVFHVEPVKSKKAEASEVSNLEPGISFHWVKISELANLDLRPAAIKSWLVSGSFVSRTDRPDWRSVHE